MAKTEAENTRIKFFFLILCLLHVLTNTFIPSQQIFINTYEAQYFNLSSVMSNLFWWTISINISLNE